MHYENNYKFLISKLDEFIRKYYKNQLIKGLIYSASLFLFFFLIITISEYFGHFSSSLRTILFYAFICINLYIVWKLILIPLSHFYRFGKIISHQQAAQIIGDHFQNIKDKLLNTLQLKNLYENAPISATLIEAGINQKITELRPIPFSTAIDIKANAKHLKYAILPLLIILVIIFSSPAILTDSTIRLIDHSTYYEKPLPFEFTILNKRLQVIQQEDFQLNVKLKGKEIPNEIYIEINDHQYKLDKENILLHHYAFKNVQKNTPFKLYADGVYSKEYELTALPNPLILNFTITLNYPDYVRKSKEIIHNTGDLIIPAGTHVNWSFITKNTEALRIMFNDSASYNLGQEISNNFTFSKRFLNNSNYTLTTNNKYLRNKDSVLYSITVIPDLYPGIEIEQQRDTFSTKRFYFKGIIKDDYGFNKLIFHYHYLNRDTSNKSQKGFSYVIPINKNKTQDVFFYDMDFSKLAVSAGDEIEYYFEIWDNDGINGSKASRSSTMIFKAPSLEEIDKKASEKNEEIKTELQESIREAQDLQKEIRELHRKTFEKKDLDWEDRRRMEDLINKQKELENKIENIRTQNQRNIIEQSEYKEINTELLEKQQQLNELMDKLMSDDMKKMMEELENLIKNMNKEAMQEMLEKMKYDNKDIEKELDRSLELFKQLEFEQKLQENIEKLDKLSEEQENLSNKTQNKNEDNKTLKEQQESLSEKFKDFEKEMKELEQKNNALESPNNFDNPEKEQEEIQQKMQSSQQELNENKNKKASQSQKDASEKMQQLSSQLKQMQSASSMNQMQEDMNALRSLLENLVKFSFDQEKLMNDLKTIDVNNPKYLKLAQQQQKLKDDAKMIEDSLYALSKKVMQIQSIVNKEIGLINQNIEKSLDLLEDRQLAQARGRQQYIMTSANNLSLLLSEVLSSLQQQMSNQMQGMQSCNKPGSGKPSSAAQLRKMQEQLNQQIQQLKEGKLPGGKTGQSGMSEQLAKMAAQQEAIRNELNKLMQEMNKGDKGSNGNSLKKIAKEMENTETDLVNKKLTQQMLMRQQEILTRLLEAEKAERERELDEKRESNETKTPIIRINKEFTEYEKLKLREYESMKTVPPSLSPFYKKKVNDYFENIEEK